MILGNYPLVYKKYEDDESLYSTHNVTYCTSHARPHTVPHTHTDTYCTIHTRTHTVQYTLYGASLPTLYHDFVDSPGTTRWWWVHISTLYHFRNLFR